MAENNTYELYYRGFFETYYASLVNFACRYVRGVEEAEDLVQNVFAAIWNSKTHFEDRLQMRNYLYRATINSAYNLERHRKVCKTGMAVLSQQQSQDDTLLSDAIYEHELWCRVVEAVEELPERCREICRMTLDGKRPSQIAEELELSVETVKKQKKIAIGKLKKRLGSWVGMLFV